VISSATHRAAIVVSLLLVAACGGSDSSASDDDQPPDSVASTSTGPAETLTSASTVAAGVESIAFPPPGVPLDVDSELFVGDVTRLRDGGRWMFGMRVPSTLVRIDPVAGEVVELDLGLGESRAGSAQHVLVDELVWALGGPLRDTLVAVDPGSMTEVRRIQLDDDHSLPTNTPTDALWLASLRSVRQVDPPNGSVGDPIALETDVSTIAADDAAAWASLPAAAQVARIEAATGEATPIDTEPGPDQLVLHGTTLWVGHPPTGSISRIDTTNGRVVGVTDLDVSGGEAAVTLVTGLRPAPEGLWALVRFDGSPYPPVLVLLDGATGDILGARTIDLDNDTGTNHAGEFWLHRADSGTLVRVDAEAFLDGPPTSVEELAAPTTVDPVASTIAPTDSSPETDEVAATFAAFIDPAGDSSTLGLGDLAPVRDDLLVLLTAQVQGEARVTEIIVDDDQATVTFDVVVEGDIVVVPGIDLTFDRMADGTWSADPDSLCALAAGVGVECPVGS